MSSATMFTLISSDKERFVVTEEAAKMSKAIRHMIEDGCTDGGVPLHNVSAKILSKVLEYCNKHAATADPRPKVVDAAGSSLNPSLGMDDDLANFDNAFIDMDQGMLQDLLAAANYLDIKPLLDLCFQKFADMIKDKTPEQTREMLGIKNDFTAEEEEEIRRANQWAFE